MSMKTSDVSRWEELAAAAALGELDANEQAEVRELPARQRRDLDALRDELERMAGELAAVTFAHATEEMPALTRARIAGLRVAEVPRAEPPPVPSRRSRSRNWPWLVAAAALALAVLGWWRVPLAVRRAESPVARRVSDASHARTALLQQEGTRRIDWKATADVAASGARGDVVWHEGLQRGFLRISGLRANDASQAQYQLWIFDATRDEKYPVDGGVFDVPTDGEAIIPIAAKLRVRAAKLFAVTVEPPGGVVVSKRERIVLTAATGG